MPQNPNQQRQTLTERWIHCWRPPWKVESMLCMIISRVQRERHSQNCSSSAFVQRQMRTRLSSRSPQRGTSSRASRPEALVRVTSAWQ